MEVERHRASVVPNYFTVKNIIAILLLTTLTAFGQFRPNSFDTNNESNARNVVTNIARFMLAGTNNPLASITNAGTVDTNSYTESKSYVGYNAIYRTPWKVFAGQLTEANISNAMIYLKSRGLDKKGFNHVMTYVPGITNTVFPKNAGGGDIQINTIYFPSGQGYFDLVHSNGFYAGQWYDGGNVDGQSTPFNWWDQWVRQIYYLATNKWDDLWIDSEGYPAELAAELITTNRPQKSLILGYAATQGSPERANQVILKANAFRVHASTDVNSFASVLEHSIIMDTNLFAQTRPFRFGFWTTTDWSSPTIAESMTMQRLECMFSLIFDLVPSVAGSRLEPLATNDTVMAVHNDPGVYCARIAVATNSMWWLVKPRTVVGGPLFTVMALNTNSVTTNSTVVWSQLNNKLPQGFNLMATNGYSIYDCESNVWVSQAALTISISLTNHESRLFDIYPAGAISTNYFTAPLIGATTVSAIVVSNGAVRIIDVPLDSDLTNYWNSAGITSLADRFASLVLLTDYKNQALGGLWSKRDAIHPFLGGTSNSCSVNLKGTNYGWTFSASGLSYGPGGVKGNGTTGYGLSGFIPSTAGGQFAQNSASMMVYIATNTPNDGGHFLSVISDPSFNKRAGLDRFGANWSVVGLNNNVTDILTCNAGGDFRGCLIVSRTSSTSESIYTPNGCLNTETTVTTGLPDQPIGLLCRSFAGAQDKWSDALIAADSWGSGLTALEAGYEKTIIDRFYAIRGGTDFLSALVASGAAQPLVTTLATNVTSLILPPGDWEVEGNVNFNATTATVTGASGALNSTANAIPTDGSEVFSGVQVTLISQTDSVTTPRKRFNVSTPTTVYLVGRCTFTAGSVSVFGAITARRVR